MEGLLLLAIIWVPLFLFFFNSEYDSVLSQSGLIGPEIGESSPEPPLVVVKSSLEEDLDLMSTKDPTLYDLGNVDAHNPAFQDIF